MPTSPDPLDDRERRVLHLAVLAAGRWAQRAAIERRFAHNGAFGLSDEVEESFNALWSSSPEDYPDPATLPPDARAALARRLRAALAAESIIDGRTSEQAA